mgnify:FL=1|jgi:hypothetical protein
MAANTTLSTNFNVSPYFDDYDKTKDFHRILFKPGLAVQTRELTQLQTILQDQVDRFGKNVFVEGSRVSGGEFIIDDNYNFVKLPDNYANGSSITVSSFHGETLRGASSNVTAIVVGSADGTEAATNTKTLFVKYSSESGGNALFTPGERLTSTTTPALSSNTLVALNSVGTGTNVTINEGVLFAKGNFVRFDTQSVIVNRYSNIPTATVGFIVDETIVSSDDDGTLLDNATGSFNYSAPGADRLKLTATLSSFSSTAVMSSVQKQNYVEMLNIDIGQIQTKREATEYNVVRDFVANRTKDFFGDTIIKGMGLRLREHLNDGTNNGLYRTNQKGDNNKLVVGVDTGKAYVEGYDIETFGSVYVPLDKGIDFVAVEQIPVTSNYGNFVNVNNVAGDWNASTGKIVKLYSGAKTSITSATYSTGAAAGSQIGTARFKTLQHDTGNPGAASAQYRVYLTDIQMSANTFADVRGLNLTNTTTANGFADIVTTGNVATIEETAFNRSLFQIPSAAVRTLRDSNGQIDTTYTFAKTFGVSISTAGQFTINTGDSTEVFIGSGALNGSEKDEKFVLSLDDDAYATVTGTVSISGTAVTGTNTLFQTQFVVGDKIFVADSSEIRIVASIASQTAMVLTTSATTATTSAFNKYFAVGEIIDLAAVGSAGARTVSVNSTTSSSFDIKETLGATTVASVYTILNKTDAREIAKTINKNQFVRLTPTSHTAGLTGPWNLGICDAFKLNEVRIQYTGAFANNTSGSIVTTQFNLDDGQRDNFYDQARLILKSDSTLVVNSSAHLLVDVDYFTHDFSQGSGYFSVDSYPINDANAASVTTIQTEEITRYVSPVTGSVHDLRNTIDTRPSKGYTATATGVVGSSSTNPATSSTYNSAAGGLRLPVANKNFLTDYSFYLARRDILTLDKKGLFTVVRGVPSLNPEAPRVNTNAMKLATVAIAPYPSLTSYRSSEVKRSDYKSSIVVDKQKRFTARDLSALEQRITNLEYYTALNQVERKAMDQTILDSTGIDRFKNGIFTDPFLSHKFGDYTNLDYKVAVDQGLQEARPQFDLTDVKLDYSSATNLTSFKSNTFFTLPHTSVQSVSQPFATTTRNIAGLFYTYEGSMTLSPDGDYWVDTRRNPDLNVDYDFTNIPWEQMVEPWQSNWSNWETLVTGAPSVSETLINTELNTTVSDTFYSGFGDIIDAITTTATDTFRVNSTTTSAQQRQRTSFNVDTTVETRNYGDRVVDVSLTPYLRSISIEVSVVGMKPNTKLTAFFDNEEVGAYCTQTDSSFNITGTRGGDITVDLNGNIYLLFTIPNDAEKRFRTGDRMFVLTDSPTNSTIQGLYTTRAIAHFNGSGIQQTVENTIVSTRVPFIAETVDTDSRNVSETTFLGTRADSRTVSVTQDFVISPTGKSYENVAWISGASLNLLTSKYGSPDVSLGECITELNENVTFWQLVSNSNATDIRQTFETQMLEIFNAGTATQATLNQFMSDFNTITGSAITDISIRNQVNSARWVDPVMQTFTIDDTSKAPGMFITKADLFFATKDATNGVQVELREIEQGTQTPTNRIIPHSIKVLPAASINVSDTGVTATTFEFDAPVYLLNGVTYGLVIKPVGNNSSTTVWVSRLGGEDVATGLRVNEQPYVGVLYASSNDQIYTPIQEEDLKFNLHRASFDQTLTGQLIIANQAADYMTVSNLAGIFIVGETVTGSSTSSTGKLKEIYTDANGIIRAVVSYVSGAFSTADTLTGSQSGATINVDTIYDVDLHVAHNEVTSITPSGTTLGTAILTTSNNNVVSSTYLDVDNTRDVKFNTELKIASRTTEINSLSSVSSYRIRNTMKTNNSFVSPVIDLTRSFVTAVGNRLGSSVVGEDSKSGGAAVARYVSRIVTLAEGQDAEDINVFLDEYRPSTSNVRVYAKILNGSDTETFGDKSWIELTKSSKELYSSVDSPEEFVETYYTFPSASLTGSLGEVQYQDSNSVTFTGYKYFAVKIVMTGTNKATPPRVRNLRAIALQL